MLASFQLLTFCLISDCPASGHPNIMKTYKTFLLFLVFKFQRSYFKKSWKQQIL